MIPISPWHLPLGPSRPLWSFAPAVLITVPVVLPVMDRKELKTHFPLSLLLNVSSSLPLLFSCMIMRKQTREVRLGRLMGNSFPLSASLSNNMCLYCFSSSFWSWSCPFMSVSHSVTQLCFPVQFLVRLLSHIYHRSPQKGNM